MALVVELPEDRENVFNQPPFRPRDREVVEVASTRQGVLGQEAGGRSEVSLKGLLK